ncbi:MAG: glyceraldehyde 3-phosphate dehydrogenase NAD-binding domain-containing protein [bacterium]|nr:glyceraldehyde 3-phosphate dehydrogenase NAD-binding domain-containing protein [bacterium]
MAKIAINGFGRIGRLFFRQVYGEPSRTTFGKKGLDIVAINDLGDIENLAYLLKYDSVYRTYDREVSFDRKPNGIGGDLIVDGKKIVVVQEKDLAKLPWGAMKIDVVVESTGAFESFEKSAPHVNAAGAKRVVISAPAKDDEGVAGGKTILAGLSDDAYATCKISSNGSCTTNGTAPVVAVMHEAIGVQKAFLNTTHGYTATQNLVDGPTRGKDFRRGRAAAVNITPSFTGAAISVTRGIPDLNGKFDGVALRVPVITGSMAAVTFLAKKKTTKEEVNDAFRKAAASKRWKGVLGVSEDQLVSSDIIGMSYATMVDLQYTKVVDGDLVTVFSWYDNEWGYVTTLVDHVEKAAKSL